MERVPFFARQFRFLQNINLRVSKFIERFLEEFVEMLSEMGRSYSPQEILDPVRKEEFLLQKFVRMDKARFGRDSPCRVFGLVRLGDFYRQRYNYGQAETYYVQAFELVDEKGWRHHMVNMAVSLHEFYLLYGKARTAKTWLERALPHAQDQNKRYQVKELLAETSAELQENAEAIALYLELIHELEAQTGLSDTRLPALMRRVSDLSKLVGNTNDAALFRDCYDTLEMIQLLEKKDRDGTVLVPDLVRLAALYRRRSKHEIARDLQERAEFIRLLYSVTRTQEPEKRAVKIVSAYLRKRAQPGDESVAIRLERRIAAMEAKGRR